MEEAERLLIMGIDLPAQELDEFASLLHEFLKDTKYKSMIINQTQLKSIPIKELREFKTILQQC